MSPPASPISPTKREYDEFIRSLADEIDASVGWKAAASSPHKYVFDESKHRLNFLFFKDRTELDKCLQKFRSLPRDGSSGPARLFIAEVKRQYRASKKKYLAGLPSRALDTAQMPLTEHEALIGAQHRQAEFSGTSGYTLNTSYRSGMRSAAINSAQTSFFSADTSFTESVPSGRIESAATSFTILTQDDLNLPPSTSKLLDSFPDTVSWSSPLLQEPSELEIDQPGIRGPEDVPNLQTIPSLEHYLSRSLAEQELFIEETPTNLCAASTRVRYECTRFAIACDLSIKEIGARYSKQWEDYDILWDALIACLPVGSKPPARSSQAAWGAACSKTNLATMTGSLRLQPDARSTLFKLDLSPLVVEPTSNRFHRKFGAHRFLRLRFPALPSTLPQFLNTSHRILPNRIQQWLTTPDKSFLGYLWSVLYVRPFQRKPRERKDDDRGFDFFLFATSGSGLAPIYVAEVAEWFLPIRQNPEMTICKAYARIELGLSKTYPTIVFSPSQIKEMPDILANGEVEDTTFNDPSLMMEDSDLPSKPKVMNDGCGSISLGAAKLIWSKLKGQGRVPSAFQARLGPWKGMWVVAKETREANNDRSVWIEVSESQKKFISHEMVGDNTTFDADRLTFEVIAWPWDPAPKGFYVDYLPILEDRGVPRACLRSLLIGQLEHERSKIHAVLNDSAELYSWMQGQYASSTGDGSTESIEGSGQMNKPAEKIKMLLEAGFHVRQLKLLADLALHLFCSYFTRISSTLRTASMGLSTNLLGVADPIGCLRPGEIHVRFSHDFVDERTGMAFSDLEGYEVLISRHPALRPSDIQKVKAVCKAELQHLQNVVVCPTTGSVPLASKLQGGDYDGDTFWLCWEPAVVEPFRNAFVSSSSKPPEAFGIKVDRRPLSVLFNEQNPHLRFLETGVAFTCQPQFLGACTNLHTALCYRANSISSPGIDAMADLHDHLVDCAKNGYTLSKTAWQQTRKFHTGTHAQLPEPPYKKATLVSINAPEAQQPHFKQDHVIDFLVSEARNYSRCILDDFKSTLSSAIEDDQSLSALYKDVVSRADVEVKVVLESLEKELQTISRLWPNQIVLERANAEQKRALHHDFRLKRLTQYRRLLPVNSSHPWIRGWTIRPAKHAFNFWELLKASTLFAKYHHKADFTFNLAGRELCRLKADSMPSSTLCVANIFSNMKMKKPKTMVVVRGDAGEAEDDDDYVDALEHLHISEDAEFYDVMEMYGEMSQLMASQDLNC